MSLAIMFRYSVRSPINNACVHMLAIERPNREIIARGYPINANAQGNESKDCPTC